MLHPQLWFNTATIHINQDIIQHAQLYPLMIQPLAYKPEI